MIERGVIRNKDFKNQVSNFSGLKYGNITPTDIDAYIEFQNELFIFVEAKFSGAELKKGQQMAFERLCDGLNQPSLRYAYFIIADHETPAHFDIDFSDMKIREIRQNKKWCKSNKDLTVRDAIYWMMAYAKSHKKLSNIDILEYIEPGVTHIDELNMDFSVWSKRKQGDFFNE